MQFDPTHFLKQIQRLVTGHRGFWKDIPMPLGSLDLNTTRVVNTSDAGSATDPVLESGAFLTADETNARVVKVDDATDSIFHFTLAVPRDYDETNDGFKVRVLASQLTSSTDDDVELDAEVYVKTAGSALGSDLNPTAPGTVLSTTEQWVEIDLSGNSLKRGDVVNFELITNGANDTDGEEVLIHAVEATYRSTLVAFDKTIRGD